MNVLLILVFALFLDISLNIFQTVFTNACDKIAVAPEQRLPVELFQCRFAEFFSCEAACFCFDDVCQGAWCGKRVCLVKQMDMVRFPVQLQDNEFLFIEDLPDNPVYQILDLSR